MAFSLKDLLPSFVISSSRHQFCTNKLHNNNNDIDNYNDNDNDNNTNDNKV